MKLTIEWNKAAIRDDQMFLFLRTDPAYVAKLEGSFHPDSTTAGDTTVPFFRSMDRTEHMVILPAKPGRLSVHSEEPSADGQLTITDHDIEGVKNGGPKLPAPPAPPASTSGPLVVRLDRTAALQVRDEALTHAIQESADGLSFARFSRFADLAFCDNPLDSFEKAVQPNLLKELAITEKSGLVLRADSFERLEAVADIFVLANARLRPPAELSLVDRRQENADVNAYLNGDTLMPYLRLVYERLGIPIPSALKANGKAGDAATDQCREVLDRRQSEPCLIELIWSYWHEEAMQSQTMAAISQRFQNRRSPGDRDPLAQLEIDPLRPLNHLMWGFAQSENDRLSVLRRAHEYEHEYGFPLHGKAVAPLRPADRRSKFLEAFHNLLYRCVQFYKEDDDTTHVADGFPVLNALKETHYVLAQGAHNQFGDLPAQARKEMLVEQWILSRTEMREFLGGRPMVAYPEAWMDRVDTVKTLKGWTDVSVVHFHDLAVFGEQLLLSIRWPALSVTDNPDVGKAWARDWRPHVQGYIHALRATLGLDLAADITSGRDESDRYLPPSVHLRRRLKAQAVAAR
jgi:hypothetical protein